MSIQRLAAGRSFVGVQHPPPQNPTAIAYGMPTAGPAAGYVGRRIVQSGTGHMARIQSGTGRLQDLKGYLDTIGAVAPIARAAYTGPIATSLRNRLPSSDDTARPGFRGEAHAILRLPNGRPGIANFAGPGTRVGERLARGDPPRTATDRVARAHDVRYALARDDNDVRLADEKMVKALRRVKSAGADRFVNTEPALRAIQGKLLLERTGLVGPRTFAERGGIPTGQRQAFQALADAEDAAGYGLTLPGRGLKEVLLAQSAPPRIRRKAGRGPRGAPGGFVLPGGALSLPGGADVPMSQLAAFVVKAMPSLWKVLSKMSGIPFHKVFARGRGLKLAGQGKVPSRRYPVPRDPLAQAMAPLLMSGQSIQFGAGVLDSLRSGLRSMKKGVTEKVLPGLKKFAATVAPFAKEVAGVVLPIMLQVALTKGMAPAGAGLSGGYLPPPSLTSRFISAITRLLARAFGGRGLPRGQSGMGFWSDFARGFMSVMKPAWSVAKAVAPVIPMLL